jgi:aspartyl-tRNA synthetase
MGMLSVSRRDALHHRIQQRAAVVTAMRQRLENQGFLEVSTPI